MTEKTTRQTRKHMIQLDTKTVIMGLITIILAFCAWWAKGVDAKVDKLTCDMASVKTALGIDHKTDTCEK